MEAIAITKFGGIDVFKNINLPKPEVMPGQVLIKVAATSVNPLDYKIRQGNLPGLVSAFPAILHGDVAGIIEEVGAGITQFEVGDEVYGCVGGVSGMGGGLAEYIAADADLLAHKPASLSLLQSAALPLVALTAWEGLITYANVQKDQTVLIHGATGGVGHVAIQLAHYLGANVFSTASSASKIDIAKSFGAKNIINYKETSIVQYVKDYTQGEGFEVVFDTVGGENLANCFAAAANFGSVISIMSAGEHDLAPAFVKGLTLHNVFQPLPLITGLRRAHYGNILANVAKLVDAGIIQPLIDKRNFSLEEVGVAHDYLESGQAIGKVVIVHQ